MSSRTYPTIADWSDVVGHGTSQELGAYDGAAQQQQGGIEAADISGFGTPEHREASSRRHNLRPRSVVRADEGFDADDDPPWEGDDMYDDSGDEEGQLDGMRGRKKKIGRPIAYTGDPEDPRLTEAERRRIRRRIANRESARRARMNRQQTMEQIQAQMERVQREKVRMESQLRQAEAQVSALSQQLGLLRDRWGQSLQDNLQLQNEVSNLRSTLEHAGAMLQERRQSQAASESTATMPAATTHQQNGHTGRSSNLLDRLRVATRPEGGPARDDGDTTLGADASSVGERHHASVGEGGGTSRAPDTSAAPTSAGGQGTLPMEPQLSLNIPIMQDRPAVQYPFSEFQGEAPQAERSVSAMLIAEPVRAASGVLAGTVPQALRQSSGSLEALAQSCRVYTAANWTPPG